jgi:ABC-type nitrate/sulfonate/bicarbonate transport system substrate-binding protein
MAFERMMGWMAFGGYHEEEPEMKLVTTLGTVVSIVGLAILAMAPIVFAGAAPLMGPVLIMTGTDYNFTPARIAEAKGLFKKYGVDAAVQKFNSGADAIQAFRSHRSAYAIAADLPSMKTWAVGDVVGISPLVSDVLGLSIVAAKDIQSPADLKGKKVGMIFGASEQIALYAWLEANGIRSADFQPVNLGHGDMPPALLRGDIAAFIGNLPTVSVCLKAVPGSHVLQKGTEGYLTDRQIVNASRAFAQGNPQLTVAVLSALRDAETLIRDHPEEAFPVIAEWLGVSVDTARANMAIFTFDMTFSDAFVRDLTLESERATQLGFVKQPIDWKTQFETQYLRTVDSRLVTARP